VLRRLSIRWKLALTSAALTFAILCAFAVVVGKLTEQRIEQDFTDQLSTAANTLADRMKIEVDIDTGKAHVTPNVDAYALPERAVIRVLQRNGTALRETRRAPSFGLAPVGITRVGDHFVATRPVTLVRDDGTPAGQVYVQYARRVSDLEATVGRVKFFLLLGVLGGTGFALLAGYLIARRAMTPIAALTATAREIGATDDLSRRVPQPESDDEVGELARTLDAMLGSLQHSRQETEAMLERQRRFVADASHELRTPLTSVLANLELLTDVLDGEKGEAARSALRSSQRMRRLVSDLLLLARADANRTAPRAPTDLAEILVEAASELEPVCGEHELLVEAGGPALVEGARDELHRMALNLLENAVRHTPPGTRIHATVAGQGDDVCLVVEDDGPGVPEALHDRLFERFVRGAGDRGGSVGLGLSIVKAVAESHGGAVRLESPAEHGRGARFVVRLPAAEPAASPRLFSGAGRLPA
jgi:two-component system OmpR family sensor kinase